MLIHEEKAEYSPWLKLLFIIPAGLLIAAIVLAFNQRADSFPVFLGEAACLALLFYFIMPRKYQIYQDKLTIVLGNPLAVNIPLSTIKEVRHFSGFKAYTYSGVRFATSSRYVVEISRSQGLNYLISPQNGDLFLEQLSRAMKSTITG
jgi:hypothetical protein